MCARFCFHVGVASIDSLSRDSAAGCRHLLHVIRFSPVRSGRCLRHARSSKNSQKAALLGMSAPNQSSRSTLDYTAGWIAQSAASHHGLRTRTLWISYPWIIFLTLLVRVRARCRACCHSRLRFDLVRRSQGGARIRPTKTLYCYRDAVPS